MRCANISLMSCNAVNEDTMCTCHMSQEEEEENEEEEEEEEEEDEEEEEKGG